MLGFPVAAFVAAGAAGGLNPSIYSDAIGFVTGVCFVGAAFIEIHRLDRTRVEVLREHHGGLMNPLVAPPQATQAA